MYQIGGSAFENLPNEILIKIFECLNYWDRIEVSLVCKRFFDAVMAWHPQNRRLMFLRTDIIDDNEPPVTELLKSDQSYQYITIDHSEIGNCTKFWFSVKDHVQELEIIDPEIKRKQLFNILQHLSDLRCLKLVLCRDLFMYNRFFASESDEVTLRNSFSSLRELCIADNRYLSDAFFSRLTPLMPSLESLNLSGCQISFHKGLYRKFYPNSSFQKGASESILTFHFIEEFIANKKSTLVELNFSRTLIDGDALERLANIEGLHLERLHLVSCDQLTNTGLMTLIAAQPSLTLLDLSSCVRVTDQCLQCISKCLPNLSVLRLKLCRAITDLGIVNLTVLSQLEELDVSGCEFVTGSSIEQLTMAHKRRWKRLYLSALSNIQERPIIKLAENFSNLTVLDLGSSRIGATNRSVQALFQHARKLQELNLSYCESITDAGLLGLDLSQNTDSAGQPQATTSSMANGDMKISLRSKAEQEIVNDAILKNQMQLICQTQNGDINQERSIMNLRGLRVLKLTGCNKVTDVSLSYCFKFLELKSLTLAKCHQVSVAGLQDVVKFCPSLEILNLSECQNIDDKAVKLVSLHVNRLTELYIDRCFKLTDHTLDAIATNCKYLRVLDVRGCRSMCPEPRIRLETVHTLRNLIVSKPGPYTESSFFPQAPVFRLS